MVLTNKCCFAVKVESVLAKETAGVALPTRVKIVKLRCCHPDAPSNMSLSNIALPLLRYAE